MKKWTIIDDDEWSQSYETREQALASAIEAAKNDPNVTFYVVEVHTRVSCFVEEPAVTEVV